MNNDPLERAAEWFKDAQTETKRRNPLAMALATASEDAQPAVRMVLPKHLDTDDGFIVFYTHYESRKGRELVKNPRAAGVIYWAEFGGRQLRVEGQVVRSPSPESDAYYSTRPVDSQINAWASRQSEELATENSLQKKAQQQRDRFGLSDSNTAENDSIEIPRPEHWGGFRLWLARIEFWTEGAGRFHEREHYERTLESHEPGQFRPGPWSFKMLQP